MRAALLVAFLALAATAAAPTANATDFCNGNGPVIDVAGQAYVAIDSVLWPWLISMWVYLETNGQPNLQRGGVTLLGDADICQDSRTPDQGVF